MATETTLIGRAAGTGDGPLYLEKKNGHPRDDLVRFDEEPHYYYIKDKTTGEEHKVNTSVTTLIGTCTDKFDAIAACTAMKRCFNPKKEWWPREEHMVNVEEVEDKALREAFEALKAEMWPNPGLTREVENPVMVGEAIRAMKEGQWPREEYKKRPFYGRAGPPPDAPEPDANGYIPMTEEEVATLWRGGPEAGLPHRVPCRTFEEALAMWRKEGRRVKTDAEISAVWRANGDRESALGTNMHALLELHANHVPYEIDETCPSAPDTRMGVQWLADMKERKGWIPWRTEWIVWDEDYDLAGSIDLVMIDPKGDLHIVDYKRCDTTKAGFGNSFRRFMKPPLNSIPDCTKTKWSCQVNAYRHIIEKNYGKTVASMQMAVFRTDKCPRPLVFSFDRDDTVLKLLHQAADRAAVRRAMGSSESSSSLSDWDLEEEKKEPLPPPPPPPSPEQEEGGEAAPSSGSGGGSGGGSGSGGGEEKDEGRPLPPPRRRRGVGRVASDALGDPPVPPKRRKFSPK